MWSYRQTQKVRELTRDATSLHYEMIRLAAIAEDIGLLILGIERDQDRRNYLTGHGHLRNDGGTPASDPVSG